MRRTYYIENKSKKLREDTLKQLRILRDNIDDDVLDAAKKAISPNQSSYTSDDLKIDKQKNINTIKTFLEMIEPDSDNLKALKEKIILH